MGKTKPPEPPGAAARPFNNPFGSIAERLGMTPAPAPAGEPARGAAPAARPGPARAVVRLERKGRGGKEATIVEKLDLPAAQLEAWSLELKRALGCGGGVEDGSLVVHGDQRARAKAWLEARGVRKVTMGS
jgi:translation initiation factor 1